MGLFRGIFRGKKPEVQMQELEKQLLSMPRIFVDNDAIAFFDVNNFDEELISVAEIKDEPAEKLYGQQYNHLVNEDKIHYFRTDGYEGPFGTVSVTTSCIVFCSYITDENGRIKSSGVYHAESMPPSEEFQKRLYKLIDTVKLELDGTVTVKVAGSDRDERGLQKIREDLTKILAAKDVKIEPEHLLFGGGSYRITEFYPRNGQLISYFSNSEQKTIL